jgi:hypothetical protein
MARLSRRVSFVSASTTLSQAVEEDEDEHLYHTQGWCRELWLQSLGQPAVLPPPEERKDVKTAIGAARAKQSRRPVTNSSRKARSGRWPRAFQAGRTEVAAAWCAALMSDRVQGT